MPLDTSHDPLLVILSIAIAVFASYTALDLAGRVRRGNRAAHYVWLAAAATAVGGGIWAMHFIAMLALRMPMSVSYDLGLTLLSLVAPILVASIGFYLVCTRGVSAAPVIIGGAIVGAGIVTMHYIGMSAMRMGARIAYDGPLVVASVIIAVVAATAALWLAFTPHAAWQRIAAAPVMGGAIAGMHYTAMAAATFLTHGEAAAATSPNPAIEPVGLALNITVIGLALMVFAVTASAFDRRFALLSEQKAALLRDAKDVLERRVQERTADLEAALAGLQRAVADKDVLLREVHHRVKNNLQVIASLLHLQGRRVTDDRARQIFAETYNRILSISLVHQMLYSAEGRATIAFTTYLRTLGTNLAVLYEAEQRSIAVEVVGPDVDLDLDVAVPAALIANELMTNALKHAFPQGNGTVTVAVNRDPGLWLSVMDDGVGLPESALKRRSESLGLLLIDQLAAQIGGTVQVETVNGTAITVRQEPAEKAA